MPDTVLRFDQVGGAWPTLFLGNGASINVCSSFSYSSLYESAVLSAAAVKLFSDFSTTNFELVLELLNDARRVGEALGSSPVDRKLIQSEYDDIRHGLFDAISSTHIRHEEIPRETLVDIAESLLSYRRVFTTNYDLVAYWSLMAHADRDRCVDFFRRHGRRNGPLTFDPAGFAVSETQTELLHLHGGLHLWQEGLTGLTGKWARGDVDQLLRRLTDRYGANPDRQPLLVSEGTARDKRRAIRRSDYLSFALKRLTDDAADTVIFGSGFDSRDQHIVEAIKAGPRRRIAISVPSGDSPTRRAKRVAHLKHEFWEHEVLFFIAGTHPLGKHSLKVR